MKAEATSKLNIVLRYLGMDREYSGLRWVAEKEQYSDDPDIYLELERAAFFGATAVYFRLFPKSDLHPPKPQVYIYNYDNTKDVEEKSPDIHRSLWNSGVVPFCFIYAPSKICIYNCSKVPKADPDSEKFITKPHEIIKLAGNFQKKLQRYAASKFDSGLFWETEPGKSYQYNQSAYAKLLEQLKTAKENVINRMGNEHSTLVKKLLVILILIKYLEERIDESGNTALRSEDFYAEFNPQNPTLSGIFDNADDLLAVLRRLSSDKHFNGQIFQLTEEESKQVKKLDLDVLKAFTEGNIEIFGNAGGTGAIGQMTIWRLYSFDYLPIELISHIYEDFLTEKEGKAKPGVVYTPPYLVQFLIDRCMPLSKPKKDFKVLDPACGSGIFLVGAFKRMIQWWRIQNNWKKPDKENIEDLKEILKRNIYGCDIEEEAVRLTYFSVSLALLDALSPREIWGNVHFDKLISKNLFCVDFFQNLNNNNFPDDFDLIIGNPPFESKFTEAAKITDSNARASNPDRPKIPDQQIALLFLEQSLHLLRQGGNCCLLLSSGPLLYNTNVHGFKRYLFENNYFQDIYDFTPLRSKLFKSSTLKAKPAAVAVLVENSKPENKPVHHLIFRNTRVSGEKIEFEIDHYDFHRVPHKSALDSPKVWQANFMGGGRLHQLVARISTLPTLKDYLDKMVETKGWKVGQGWIKIQRSDKDVMNKIELLQDKINLSSKEKNELQKLKHKYVANWITDYPYIKTEDLDHNGIIKTEICPVKYFHRHRKDNKEIFEPPHLLIKESVKGKKIPVVLSNEYLTFKNKIFGIHAPKNDLAKLNKLEKYLSSSDKVALMWLLSGQVITSREAVPLKADILSLPDPSQNFKYDTIEEVLLDDIIYHYTEFRKNGEKSKILNKVSKSDLTEFGDYYCRILNSVYDSFHPSKPVFGEDFIVFPFILGETPEIEIPESIESIEEILRNLINHKAGYNLWIKRILRVYHKNVIFLYKPNQKRYWLRSIAIRDADETFLDLFKQGK